MTKKLLPGILYLLSLTLLASTSSCGKDREVIDKTIIIASIQPEKGKVGATLSIAGQTFSNRSRVTFGNVEAQVVSATSTLLTVIVPSISADSYIQVVDQGMSSNKVLFTLIKENETSKLPLITRAEPAVAFPEDTVRIHGSYFDDTSVVKFGSLEAKIVERSDERLTVVVPDIKSEVWVTVANGGRISNRVAFYLAKEYETLLLENLTYQVDSTAHYKVGPGTYYSAIDLMHAQYPLKAHFLTVDLTNEYNTIKPVLANDTILENERVVHMAARKSTPQLLYFAGVNADFFETSGSHIGYMVNGMALEGHMITFPYKTSTLTSFIVDKSNNVYIDKVHYSGSLNIKGLSYAVDDANWERDENRLILYNQYHGGSSRTNRYGTEVLIAPESGKWELNTPMSCKVEQVYKNQGNNRIPPSKAILSAHGSKQDVLNGLEAGDVIELEMKAVSERRIPYPFHIVGGGEIILQNGSFHGYNWDERHPRTALGISQDGNKLILCVVDGRWELSAGVTTRQLAYLVKRAGAHIAYNLDGGGSSTLYAFNSGYNGTGLMNRPQGGTYTRPVSNAIFIASTAPQTDGIKEIASANHTLHLKRGDTQKLHFYGLNEYGIIVNNDLAGVELSAPVELGSFSGDTFQAVGTQKRGKITAKYNGMTTTVQVYIGDGN